MDDATTLLKNGQQIIIERGQDERGDHHWN
jgi:hypothetical protein